MQDCAEWDASSAFACTKAYSTEGKADLSKFAIALTSFHMSDGAELIVSASISTPEDTGFSIVLTNAEPSGYSSRLKSASCSLLEIGKYAPDIQCGEWTSHESQKNGGILLTKSERITFPMVYDGTPQVLVWLRGLDLSPMPDRTLHIGVGTINRLGFTLAFNYQKPHTIRNVEISWLACSAKRSDVRIGTFSTGDMSGRTKCDGYVAFESGRFQAPPTVAVGITFFDIDKRYDLSLFLEVVEVTSEGMKWRIKGGEGGTITSASGSFIAFE